MIDPVHSSMSDPDGVVLGIESSCDETGVALYSGRDGLVGDALYSQVELHARYGGVVPELASRDHVRKTLPLIEQVMQQAGVGRGDLAGVAYTAGPGLVGALLVGASVGRSLAFGLGLPAIGVHHMEGHLLAPMLEPAPPAFPFVALLVSGGHTMLVEVLGVGRYRVLGQSLDDAAGEAFDKTAKLLGLGYPGGPAVATEALSGDPSRFRFPRPMVDRPGLDFSFSGLKTFTRNTVEQVGDGPRERADVARAFQDAVVDTLAIKCRRALQQTGHSTLVVAGGVGANLALRERLGETASKLGARLFYPRLAFCTDNGAMIAYAGWLRLRAGQTEAPVIVPRPRWSLETLAVV